MYAHSIEACPTVSTSRASFAMLRATNYASTEQHLFTTLAPIMTEPACAYPAAQTALLWAFPVVSVVVNALMPLRKRETQRAVPVFRILCFHNRWLASRPHSRCVFASCARLSRPHSCVITSCGIPYGPPVHASADAAGAWPARGADSPLSPTVWLLSRGFAAFLARSRVIHPLFPYHRRRRKQKQQSWTASARSARVWSRKRSAQRRAQQTAPA